jgi:hypothetical protein
MLGERNYECRIIAIEFEMTVAVALSTNIKDRADGVKRLTLLPCVGDVRFSR